MNKFNLFKSIERHSEEPSEFFKQLKKNPQNYATRDGRQIVGFPRWFSNRFYPISVLVEYVRVTGIGISDIREGDKYTS